MKNQTGSAGSCVTSAMSQMSEIAKSATPVNSLVRRDRVDVVAKGDQIGYFQFGGSTHCLVFRSDVIAEFALQALPQGVYGENSANVPVNSYLARSN